MGNGIALDRGGDGQAGKRAVVLPVAIVAALAGGLVGYGELKSRVSGLEGWRATQIVEHAAEVETNRGFREQVIKDLAEIKTTLKRRQQ